MGSKRGPYNKSLEPSFDPDSVDRTTLWRWKKRRLAKSTKSTSGNPSHEEVEDMEMAVEKSRSDDAKKESEPFNKSDSDSYQEPSASSSDKKDQGEDVRVDSSDAWEQAEHIVAGLSDEQVDLCDQDEQVNLSDDDEQVDLSDEDEQVDLSDEDEVDLSDDEDQAEDFAEVTDEDSNFEEGLSVEDVYNKSFKNNDEFLNEIIFANSLITRKDLKVMILSFSVRHSTSREATKDLILFVETLAGKKLCINTNNLESFLPSNTPKNTYNFYCKKCKNVVQESKNKSEIKKETVICDACSSNVEISLQTKNFFISLDIEYQIKTALAGITSLSELLNFKNKNRSDNIKDIYDGKLYKDNIENKFNLSLNWNTDGASVFVSSKNSMWPILLTINELPPSERFRNIILAGIWYDKFEPPMNAFMKVFARQIFKLAEDGFTLPIKEGNEVRSIHLKINLLCGCVDSVAKPQILNCTQFNGFFGCSYCFHPGKIIDRTVKYTVMDPVPAVRNHREVVSLMREAAQSGKRCQGLKGPSALLLVKNQDLVWGLPIDYMHCVLIGVVGQMLELWTSYSKNIYYIGSNHNRAVVNDALANICPPNEIHRLPRSLTEKAKWKASEKKNWLLFFAVPCLINVLDKEVLTHFMLLQNSIFTLLQESISKEELAECQENLNKFVRNFQEMYGPTAMTFNVHLLTHLVESVVNTGPLWATSAFCFESEIFFIKQFVTGPMGVPTQIVEKNFKEKQISNMIKRSEGISENCVKFCESISKHIVQNKPKIKLLGNYFTTINERGETVQIYNKVQINNSIFCSKRYYLNKKLKYNNSYLKTKSNAFGEIKEIIFQDGEIILEVCLFECEQLQIENVSLKNSFVVKNVLENNIQIQVEQVHSKCIFVNTGNKQFVCEFPNFFEIQ